MSLFSFDKDELVSWCGMITTYDIIQLVRPWNDPEKVVTVKSEDIIVHYYVVQKTRN